MNAERKYAFLMIDYETPDFIKDLHKQIKEDELYKKDGEYGCETESHVTLVPCLSNSVDLKKLKRYLDKLSDYKVVLTDLSKFECEEYDVLKCNVASVKLLETNEEIKKDFETFSEYKDNYKPHLTIAYMKKGMADKYIKNSLDRFVILEPTNFRFSWWENDENKTEKFEK